MSGAPTFTPGGVPDGKRRRVLASSMLLHQWSEMQPWTRPPIYEFRLGPTPLSANAPVLTPQIEAMLRRWNRYADLIGFTDSEVQVVEAKIMPMPGAISQLQHYIDLVHTTPFFGAVPQKAIQGVLLWALDDPIITQRANAAGIRVVVFTPPWVQDYLNLKYFKKYRYAPAVP